jgi:hypothetical protein
VDGLLPPGSAGVAPVELHPTEVWTVGRRDPGHVAAHPDRARWHLGVPGAAADLPVNQLELRIGTVGVAVAARRGAGVVVDGVVRPSPVVLTSGTSFVSPTTAGGVDFAVTVLRAEEFAGRDDALVASGTTLTLTLRLDAGTALSRVAHALAWPVLPTVRRPHAVGWSGRDVAERLAQLGEPAEDITVLGKHLLALADKVQNCRLADGRRADTVFPVWPPWRDEGADETRDQRAERRNRCVADVLWRSGAVDVRSVDGP